ncbi:hypothetical protein ACTPEM_24040, partial [Clostridioides difficile]
GFTSACDRYNLIKEEELIRIAEKFGIGYIHNKVRDFEDNDYKGIPHSRHYYRSCHYTGCYSLLIKIHNFPLISSFLLSLFHFKI